MASEGTSRDRIEEKTRELITRLKADSDDKLIEYLLGCLPEDLLTPRPSNLRDLPDRLTPLLRSHRDLFIDIVEAEAEARTRTHADFYENVVKKYQHEPSRTADKLADKLADKVTDKLADKVTDMLTRVCHIMAVEDPLFAFHPVGVGSHHDGTKVSGQGDLDFLLQSLYQPGEGSTARSREGSTAWSRKRPVDSPREGWTKRPRRGSIDRPREDSSDRPEDSSDRPEDSSDRSEDFSDRAEDSSDRPLADYRVECYCHREGYIYRFYILPVSGTDLCSMCEERGLLTEGKLDTGEYRRQLYRLLSSVISEVSSEVGLSFGGWNKPHFEGFEKNGPALTVVVDGVSVDITQAFKAPKDIKDKKGRRLMENIAEEVSSRVSSTVSSRVSSKVTSCVSSPVSSPVSHEDTLDYVTLGLLVLSGSMYCDLSTSLLESTLIRSVPELQSALKLIKLYKENFLNLPWPDLTPYYRHLEERVFEWLVWEGGCDIVLGTLPRHPDKMVVNRLEDQALAVLSLATQSRPLTLDDTTILKLRKIKKITGKAIQITGEWIDYRRVYPSLRSMIESRHQKPLIQTISYAFKSLVLQEWIKNKRITTEKLVSKVMGKYIKRVQSGVSHPFLRSFRSLSVKVVKPHSFCYSYHLDIEDSSARFLV